MISIGKILFFIVKFGKKEYLAACSEDEFLRLIKLY